MADDPNQQLPLDNIGPGAANVQPVNIEDEMRRSYLDYSMSVIIGRALPDIRDGLKPVHRRILYAMHDMGVLHNRKHMKCAGVVGECLKKYHPHGDSAVYDAMVRLAQPWSLRYPLIDGQGNFGSVDGDPPAAYRYTESRMTEIAEELLADIDKDTVDFVANFDDTTVEPAGPADANSESAGQWLRRHRGRHGDQHSAAQPDRDCRRLHHAGEQSARHAGRHAEVRAGSGLPDRRLHSRAQRHHGSLSHRTRPLPDARQGGHRARHQGQRRHHRHRDSLPGEQVEPDQAHRRAGEQQGHRRDQRRARRERSRRHAHRHRTEARMRAADRAQPALQAHLDAGELQHDLPGRGQRPAEGNGPGAGHPALRRSPHRRGAPPHCLPADEGARARACPRGLPGCARSRRRCDPHHSRQREPRRSAY